MQKLSWRILVSLQFWPNLKWVKREKTGKRKSRNQRKNDFTVTKNCSSAVVQRAARQKKVCMRGGPRVTGTLKRATAISTKPKRDGGLSIFVLGSRVGTFCLTIVNVINARGFTGYTTPHEVQVKR